MNTEEIKFVENYWKNYHLLKREKTLLEKAYTAKELKSDTRYPKLVVIVDAIEKIYEGLDELFQRYVDVRYWAELSPTYDYSEVADMIDSNVPKLYKIRLYIMNKTALELGVIPGLIKI